MLEEKLTHEQQTDLDARLNVDFAALPSKMEWAELSSVSLTFIASAVLHLLDTKHMDRKKR